MSVFSTNNIGISVSMKIYYHVPDFSVNAGLFLAGLPTLYTAIFSEKFRILRV
jgi:hypothetical protein